MRHSDHKVRSTSIAIFVQPEQLPGAPLCFLLLFFPFLLAFLPDTGTGSCQPICDLFPSWLSSRSSLPLTLLLALPCVGVEIGGIIRCFRGEKAE